MANRYFSNKRSVLVQSVDPRHIHRAQHSHVMGMLKCEYGMGVKQIAPITMVEARNACNFADTDSVRGVSTCVAFSMGCLMGGKRPCTLASIKLEAVTLTAIAVEIDGKRILVPALQVIFRDEKFDDLIGPRIGTDFPHRDDYKELLTTSCAFWVYSLVCNKKCCQVARSGGHWIESRTGTFLP